MRLDRKTYWSINFRIYLVVELKRRVKVRCMKLYSEPQNKHEIVSTSWSSGRFPPMHPNWFGTAALARLKGKQHQQHPVECHGFERSDESMPRPCTALNAVDALPAATSGLGVTASCEEAFNRFV